MTSQLISPSQKGVFKKLIPFKKGYAFVLTFSYPRETRRPADGKLENIKSKIALYVWAPKSRAMPIPEKC